MGEVWLMRPWASDQLWLFLMHPLPQSPQEGSDPPRPSQKMSTWATSGKTGMELGTGQDSGPYSLPHPTPIFP